MENKIFVLVVEDEDILLQAISKKLAVSGIECVTAVSGKQALDYLASVEKIPDAIWLDYYLPDINGLEFVQLLKNNPIWAKIPIVIVSNSASPDNVRHMLTLGVEKYILKAEYRLDDIIKMIIETAENKKSQ